MRSALSLVRTKELRVVSVPTLDGAAFFLSVLLLRMLEFRIEARGACRPEGRTRRLLAYGKFVAKLGTEKLFFHTPEAHTNQQYIFQTS